MNEPTANELENVTRVTHPDEDAGPTKSWIVQQRNDPKWKDHYQWVYGRRPMYELYDRTKDPHETINVVDDPAYADIRAKLEQQLLEELRKTGDPRLVDDGQFFETPPMAGPLTK